MATVSKWNPFGVSLNITAVKASVTRTSASQFTVKINASWEVYYSGAQTNYGMTASSGGGSVTLNKFGTKSSSGSGSFTGTYSISGYGSGTKSITVTFKNYEEDWQGNITESATKTVTFSVTVPAWTSYTIKYNANGGSGAPSSQTKYHGVNLTISSTKPTRPGYVFAGWSLTQNGSVYYSPGSTCGKNENLTLWAVWTANAYTVTYDANGGTGAPSSQTKIYGVNLTLSSTEPTRTNYTFLGWGTAASATTVTYYAGGTYTNNSSITLYAVWSLSYTPPRITDINVYRSDESDQPADDGSNLHFGLSYESDKGVATSITWQWKTPTDNDWIGSRSTPDANSDGIVNTSTIYDTSQKNTIDPEKTYIVCITVTDSGGSTVKTVTIPGQIFPIDVRNGGTGVSFGKTAEIDGLCDIGFQTKFTGGIKNEVLIESVNLDTIKTPNVYVSSDGALYTYGDSEKNISTLLSGTFTLEVTSAGAQGQLMQRITSCNKLAPKKYERWYYHDTWGEWINSQKILWDKPYYMTEGHTATLTYPDTDTTAKISEQENGVVLVFCPYADGAEVQEDYVCHFIPKLLVTTIPGKLHAFSLCNAYYSRIGVKAIYIYDDKLVGHDLNDYTSTNNGITYNNKTWVLRYVIGV